MAELINKKKRLSSFQTIILGFDCVIFIGTLLLMLPVVRLYTVKNCTL